jgi:hypothetical protein
MTVAELQAELTKRNLDTKWAPLKGKKELQDRLQVMRDTFSGIDESSKASNSAYTSCRLFCDTGSVSGNCCSF